MPSASLTVTLPSDTWIKQLSEEHPDVEFKIVAALPGEESGVALAEIAGGDLKAILRDMEASEAVTSVDLLQVADDRVLVQFESSEHQLLASLREAGVPLELPVTVQNGSAAVELTASRDRLSQVGDQLAENGMTFELEAIRESVDAASLLTDRQRRLLTLAVERGYYETPRSCTLTDLADELGIAKSTASEILHRAEGKVLTRFVANLPTRILEQHER